MEISETEPSDLEIVKSCFFLLKSNPTFHRRKRKWSEFISNYLDHKSDTIKWFACQCIGLLLQMTESQLKSFTNSIVGLETNERFSSIYIHLPSPSISRELERHLDQSLVFATKTNNSYSVTNICGINIPSLSDKIQFKNDLIMVDSSFENLKKIALGLTTGRAICLQGTVGSGKTCLVEYLAGKTGRKLGEDFVKIQLSDETDSKMLLGTYRCTDVPGEFIWQPGVLTQAVIGGHWLLLEDIDLASMDIASVLSNILENGTLCVPGYSNSLEISSGFQLFVTQRLISTSTGNHRKHSNALKLLEKHMLQIHIDPLTATDLKKIVTTKYPQFTHLSDRMINVLNLSTGNAQDAETSITSRTTGRLTSTRDFFKWCFRAAIDFDVASEQSHLKVLHNAIDVFCGSFHDPQTTLVLAKQISAILGIVVQKAEYFLESYKPTMKLNTGSLVVGRASMKRNSETLVANQNNFYFTRLSAVLLERIMCCVNLKEPVLLVGETGTGKTSSIQYLANTLGQKLVVINMNQQSDSADLLGGFKPVDFKFIVSPIKRQFEHIFGDFFKIEPNRTFLGHITYCFNEERWSDLVQLMTKSYEAAIARLSKIKPEDMDRKNLGFLKRWQAVGEKIKKLDLQLRQKTALAFSFIEGSLVKAVEKGYWVLLDEINLANADTLECLSGLLENSRGSLALLERGDKKPVKRHPNFTLFACMNPSTDIGKKELPAGLRNRFTEFFVEELTDQTDLLLLVNKYLEAQSLKKSDASKIVKFYLKVRKATEKTFCDGLGHSPHFSLRTLCRALMITSRNPCGMFKKSLYEAFCLSFLTQLDANSYTEMERLISSCLIGDEKAVKAVLKQPIPPPRTTDSDSYLKFEGYWIRKGSLECSPPDNYILSESVRKNLRDLVRIVSIGKLPVLLQGDTSVGKTSLITYLAKSSGNKCVRINNHEHTDLQEYIGAYVADSTGKLVFREGLLVEAMKQGHWIILDELNLAPTEVLEALNRVLDDNRELYIPETQETVKADPNFMLFATQNPPGSYGGRKILSRAFRNRFVELHFNEIPREELAFILHKRCEMSLSYAKKMVGVMVDLQTRRKGSAAFAGKQGFITLRDLFRWGERYHLAENRTGLYDWDQHLADEGYLVLAGRVRKKEEKDEIIQVLHKHLKREVNPYDLFTLSEKTSVVTKDVLQKIHANQHKFPNIVWTYNMRQLAVMVMKAFQLKEPVLLVGETGGGKTSVCKIIAEQNGQELVTVNCHMNSESSDFIGGLRPVRDHSGDQADKLFEWVNGPLIQAMSNGSIFLADEISLVDDSVLERLNSLLEPERTILIAEKGSDIDDPNNSEVVTAHPNFYFIGTMNPGGDFGKKELSPALRNRFTEIWCDPCTERDDLIAIIQQNLKRTLASNDEENAAEKERIAISIIDFIDWFKKSEIGARFTISIRDILTWVNFMNTCDGKLNLVDSYIHGAFLTFLDGLGSGLSGSESWKSLETFKAQCLQYLSQQVNYKADTMIIDQTNLTIEKTDLIFGIKPFYTEIGNDVDEAEQQSTFAFDPPTTKQNALRLLRGMQLNKAILLEGSPGVGKTSLVTALAKITRHKVFRVNLSDQTDISDLFGADLPVEGGLGGQFSWKDGPLLQALKQGHWILLDELNLASQSVLEGLNACLDHRGEIFIPELARTFHVKPGTRFFACQNPLKQGGSRRGLPQSFLNRFVQVHMTSLTNEDLFQILQHQFPHLPHDLLIKMLQFNSTVTEELDNHTFGHRGSPWEFNLRDLTRWCEAMIFHSNTNGSGARYQPENCVSLVYRDRMRTLNDKLKIDEIFELVFGCRIAGDAPILYVNDSEVFIGDVSLQRNSGDLSVINKDTNNLVLRSQLQVLRSLAYCVNLNWMSLLVGDSASGKSTVVKVLASLAGKELKTLPVTSSMDTTDILGGFEQTDYTRHLDDIVKQTELLVIHTLQKLLSNGEIPDALRLLCLWEDYSHSKDSNQTSTMEEETKLFLNKINNLSKIWKKIHKLDNSAANDIENLKNSAQSLNDNLRQEGSINAGGKFEWIDSVLIKCLQNGHWLLLDNVNLCSPAVLDRLNALLEPRGVLTVGERGVDRYGQMVTVKPHPDFRLFFTMDPKNGEISRAMRNRGVEIYMLSNKEADRTDEYDLKSLISLQGLTDNHLTSALLILHNSIKDMISTEEPNISELVRVSTLISHHLRHEKDVHKVFAKNLIEVYYKSRLPNEFKCSDFVEFITKETRTVIDETRRQDGKLQLYDDRVTLKTNNLQLNAVLERVRQQGSLLSAIFEQSQAQQASRSIDDYLTWMLVNFYSITSARDLNARRSHLQNILTKNSTTDNENCRSISDALCKFVQTTDMCAGDFPLDCRWIPETVIAGKFPANAAILGLYLIACLSREQHQTSAENKANNTRNLLTYMHNKKKNTSVNLNQFDNVLVDNFLSLLEKFDRFLLTSTLESARIDDKELVEILHLLSWRFHLYRCALVSIKKLTDSQRYLIETNLKVHYCWFFKYSLVKVSTILNRDVPEDLKRVTDNVNRNLTDAFGALHKLGRNYQKLTLAPLPFVSEAEIQWSLVAKKIVDSYNICNKSNNVLRILEVFLSDATIRDQLIQIITAGVDGPAHSERLEVLQQKLIEQTTDELGKNHSQVQLMSFDDYFSQRTVRQAFASPSENTEIPRNWTLPVDLVTLLSLRAQNPRSKPKLDKSFYCYLMNSPSKWNLFDADEDELTATSGLTDYNPLLTRHLINVLITHDSVITTYGHFRQSAKQHEHMIWTLWRNLPQLCHRESDLLWQESELLRADFHSFLLELCDSLKVSSETSDRESTRICLDKLRNLLSDRPAEKLFIDLLTSCAEKILDFDTVQDLDLRMLDISSVHMELSYLKTLLNSQLTPIDPSAKTKLKKKYVKESISNFDQMRLSFVHLNEVYSGNDRTLHALHGPVVEVIDGLKAKHAQLEDYAAVRPGDVSYESVIRVINRGFSTILSPKFVKNLVQDLNEQTKRALLQDPGFSLDAAHAAYKKYSTTVLSYENIIQEWAKYSTYPDIIEPLVANLAQFLYGLSSSLNLLKKACAGYEFAKRGRHLKEVLECLVKVPTLDQKCIKYEDHVENYTDKRMYATLYGLLDHGVAERQMLRLYKCGVHETYNQCVISSDEILKSSTFQRFDNLLKIFVDTWNGQEQKREKMKEDENALYKTKTKCDEKTDEEQHIDEMKKLFPNYHVKDFSDIQVSTVLDDDPPEDITESESLDLLSSDDLKFVIDFHVSLLKSFTKTEWLLSSSKIARIDVVGPLMEKFKVFKDIFNRNVHQIDYTMDKNLLGSLNILLNHVTNHERGSDSSTDKKYYNFYKDPNVEEVKSSQHILVELVSRIKQLLEQWPDQPTLVTILNVIDRIYSFDITSPLPRFLTGFEILLTKCNEWEQVAHSGVSLCEHTQNLIRQIIAWRKIELAEWKNLMNSTFDRFNEPMYKWWIYLYNIMKQFTVSDSTDDVQQLIETLQKFMAHSDLGEFQSRLDLLFVFHCHAIHLERSEKVDTFINVMWNLYRYFEQFSSQVAKRIKVLRMPVEKKLKDYVKIVRWKDINYWTVKETVDKSHKILHKFVRDFQDVLRQPVLSCLVNNTTSDKKEDLEIWDEPQKQPVHYTLDVSAYLAKEPLRKITPSETIVVAEKPISSKLEAYSKKSRTLCKNVILKTKYPHLVQSLDDIIGDVIDTSSYLRDLEVDRTLPKEKQKSQAKSILQQKHRGLSDLFKTLSKIGLSYQTGIVEANLKRVGEDFLLKPIDLSASFKHLNRKNENLLAMWESCETYYLRSLMRFDVLETALRSSAPDLGMQNVERCRGFSSHALVYIKQQKQDLISSSRQFYYLRHYLAKITGVCEKPEFIHIKTFKHIQETLRSVILTMTQFRAILDTRPKEIFTTSDSSPEIVELTSRNGPFNYFNSDSVWGRSNICVTETLAACKDVLGILEKHQGNVPSHDFDLNQLDFIPVPEFGSILMKLSAIDLRTSELFKISEHLPICGSLRWLLSELHEIRLHPNEGGRESSEAGWRYSLENQVEKLCRKILMIIQNLYKKYETSERSCSDENDSQDTQVEENHLKVSIMENLSKDVDALEMNKLLKTLHKVTRILFGLRPDELSECKPLMLSCVPLLEQLMLLYEYFLTQQVLAYRVTCKMTSIILNIFIELVSKGFCVPPDLAEEAESSEGASKPSDGMGLGDGKGERDVSDRIESEDQLDEAQPAGAEKKDQAEDEKCPEEEKAIEMSEDFEGELQDKKPKEDDSEDSDNSDSDAEEQMGETEKNADKLDQQIWGSDDEKEEGEGDDDTGDEEEGSGETIGEKQLAAKEKDENPKNKDKKEDPSKDDKHKNQDEDEEEGEEGEPKKEIDEMREPEYEDQMDPNHLNLPEPPEPEPMDLPDDLEMAEEDEMEKDEENDEKEGDNPFDIDEMKEQNPFEKKDKQEADQDEKQRDDEAEFSGDDEDIRDNKEYENKNETEEKEDEVETNEDGKAQPEQVIEENEKEEEDEPMDSNVEEKDENTAPDQSKANEDKIEGMDVDTATAADKVESTPYQNQTSDQATEDEFYQEEQPDQEGVGQSQMQEDDTGGGHTAQTVARLQNMQQQNNKRQRDDDVNVKQKPGESDSQRSLGNVDEPVMKKLKALDDVTAMNRDDTEEGEKGPDEEEEEEAGGERSKMYEHVKEAESSSAQVLDVATKEQTEAQRKELSVLEEKEEEDKTEIENMEDAIAPEKDEDVAIKEQNKQLREDVGENRNKKDKKANHQPEGDISDEPEKMEIEGEFVKTLSAWRGDVSTFSTGFKNISSDSSAGKLSIDEINSLRADVQRQLSHWTAVPSDAEAQQAWHRISSVTLSMAQDLSEQLRLVLEPTKATRLKGDFRTGRRINMRKVIPYIASQFRKDKIWLRRSKPSKRNYQIVLALDDSASMCANNSKEMAFESVAMISKALTLLESGRLGVVSFGKETRIVHRLGEPFTEMSGTDLMKRFKFDQEKTHVDSMVEFVTEMFSLTPNESSAPNANLLVIVGDGLGVSESCISAVRRAKLANVFIIFVIIDNQENEQSILDLTNVVFKDKKVVELRGYMDDFPFDFYIVLKNINSLPNVLSDALRQWFEVVSNLDRR